MSELHSTTDYDLICLSHLRWDWVYQRPQHLMSRFGRERRVFFLEEPIFDAPAEPYLDVLFRDDNVHVLVPHLAQEWEDTADVGIVQTLRALLDTYLTEADIRSYVLWYYTPMALDFTRHLNPLAVIYDCMDELSAFSGAPPELPAREVELLQRADLVFTGGQSLYESKRTQHPSVHAFPSSVDVKHFARARRMRRDPDDQRDIPHPRLGFYGVLDERLDLDLVAGVAASRPDWHLVMVGPVTKIEEASLPQAPNIHYLGLKSYDQLPSYLSGWDVALLPFARNEATRFISPTKTPEYLAAGKPIVSTSIRDVVRPYGMLGMARIADTVDEWVTAIDQCLNEDRDQAAIDAFLHEHSWDRGWQNMTQMIEGLISYRQIEASSVHGVSVEMGESTTAGFDYLVVGAGFAGAVLAERLAAGSNKRVLVVDRRSHVGGNAFDYYNEAGILVHRYGPHIFHTNSAKVFDYLGRFTEWRPYQHRVRASVDGQLVPMPINLDTVNALYGLNLTSFQLEEFFQSVAEPIEHVRTSEDVVVSKVGRELYQKFFRGYTRKQWGMDPSELDAAVTARVPTRTNRDDRYFTDTYQAMPLHGYTRMFERILNHPNIKVMLNTDYREIAGFIPYGEMIYTGPIDEYFDLCYGKLPYRSLDFELQTHDMETYQEYPVINYPNDYAFTRVTEFKYLTGQQHPRTTTVAEYPRAEGDPYYPVPTRQNAETYARYKTLAELAPRVHFVGRLATYKYYNMDQVVAQALATYERLSRRTEERQSGELVVEVVRMPERSGSIG